MAIQNHTNHIFWVIFEADSTALEAVFTGIHFNLTLGLFLGRFLILLNCHPALPRPLSICSHMHSEAPAAAAKPPLPLKTGAFRCSVDLNTKFGFPFPHSFFLPSFRLSRFALIINENCRRFAVTEGRRAHHLFIILDPSFGRLVYFHIVLRLRYVTVYSFRRPVVIYILFYATPNPGKYCQRDAEFYSSFRHNVDGNANSRVNEVSI